jgi:transcriptional regulator with XRE-family HTH domain
LKLTKRQLSLNLNVSDVTIYLWEKNKVRGEHQPTKEFISKLATILDSHPAAYSKLKD